MKECFKEFRNSFRENLNVYMLSGRFDHPDGFNMLSIEDWSGIAKRLELKGIKEGIKVFDIVFGKFIINLG